jgi:AcrR family transcriptional regulator
MSEMPSRRNRKAARKPRSLAGATHRRGIERAQLLQSAAELFAQKGYHATSLDDIASRLRIKKTTIYHYIDAKEDLLIEIQDAFFTVLEHGAGADREIRAGAGREASPHDPRLYRDHHGAC